MVNIHSDAYNAISLVRIAQAAARLRRQMTPAVFQVLADPSRLRIIDLLGTKEQAVNELVLRMPIHQSGVSRHLGILEQAGFVQMRALGNKRLYSLRPDRFAEMDRWLAQYRLLWEGRLDALSEALKRKRGLR